MKIKTTNHDTAIEIACIALNNGFIIKKAYKKQRWFSNKLWYIVEMEKGIINYPHEIDKACAEQRFEDAAKLRDEYNALDKNVINNLFEKQLQKQIEITDNIFED